jgi:cytochrome c-type biogenesis protein CcsB
MKLLKLALSTKTTLLLLLAFAVAMAVATFVENDHGTPAARQLVYEAWWFEIIMLWLAVNFVAHIRHYRLFRPGRWPVGLFHLAFGIIILGAGVTRYCSREGLIHIREGAAEDTFYTTAHYLQLRQEGGEGGSQHFEQPLQLAARRFRPLASRFDFGSAAFTVTLEEYLPAARAEIAMGQDTFFELAIAIGGRREDLLLYAGETVVLGDLELAARAQAPSPLQMFKTDSLWLIRSDRHLQLMEMASQQMGVLHAGETQPLRLRTLYQWEGGAFVVRAVHEGARLEYVPETDEKLAESAPGAVKIKVAGENGALVAQTWAQLASLAPNWHRFEHQGQRYALAFGPKAMPLPFALHLTAFELERYPGSQSPSSYASQLMVVDQAGSFPYRIFMNHVLDHQGYRFYQSSYDTDEKGTVLSVSQDRPGTYLTYLGYLLLAVGMGLSLFAPGSRFQFLNQKLGRLKQGVPLIASLALLANGPLAQATPLASRFIVPAEQAQAYGRLIVQDLDGRMKPLNTLASEIVRKLSGKSYLYIPGEDGPLRLSPEQFLLAVQLDPQAYSALPLIKIHPKKSDLAFAALGMAPQSRISFQDFLGQDGRYLLQEMVEEANRLKPAERNESHKELLKTDERFNIFYALLSGDFLRLFPNRMDENNTWFTAQQHQMGFQEEDAVFVSNITALYLAGLDKGLREGDWPEAEEALSYIQLFQQKAGAAVYPAERRIEAELYYNRWQLGNRLFGPFWLLGALMLALGIVQLFRDHRLLRGAWLFGKALALLGLLLFSLHLGLRWYVAQHPPWSDGFEMLVFVAWGILAFALLFSGKSPFTIPLGLLFSGTLLFVSFLDWLNPEITNLMPVLHSYWLKIHVAIIVSGYAPLALAAIIALLSLLLLVFKPSQPAPRWWASMQELRIVNEISITCGLFLLAVGTFLGGVWANESWGRYWAWDPKETWALISIIVYAIVLHLRLVPGLKSALVYNLAALWAFSSIIMTSFGVNYYLSGLHSYAKGDPVPIPGWVYWVGLALLVISASAALRHRQLSEEGRSRLIV